MKRTALLALLLLVLAGSGLHAQTFSLISGRAPLTSLDGLWRFHTGDNPAWANSSFDDSHWPLIRSGESWTNQGYPAFTGYAWYRFKIETAGDGKPLDLLLSSVVSGYEIYADGKLIGSAGAAAPTRDPVFSAQPAMFPLPLTTEGPHPIQIALRVWVYDPVAFWAGAGSDRKGNYAGDPHLLSTLLGSARSNRSLHFVSEYTHGFFAALIGLAILALFLLHPADKEYLWFSILLLAASVDAALHLMLNLGSLPLPLWDTLRLIASGGSLIAALGFFSLILRARRSFLWWTVCTFVAASPLTAGLIYFRWTGMGISYAIAAACFLPAYLWIIAKLLRGAFREDASAKLLVVPVTLSYGMYCASISARVVAQLAGSSTIPFFNMFVSEWPFEISLGAVIDYMFILALLIFLMRRFSLARKEEERLAVEFEAARSVQSLLIPAVPPQTPGFAVEHVYLPATEVGGDFFQVLPGDDGSLLIVVGDVSGKGLKAAMTVSAIVGALRGCTLRGPAEVLAHLNHVLHGQIGGLVTCCAARIAADGIMTIANAGHLSPYRNGQELPCAGGLPLGVSGDGSYEETQTALALGTGSPLSPTAWWKLPTPGASSSASTAL
jgi:phosphoserine phosphatase RsbU/P